MPGGKLEEGRPSPLAKFNGLMQDFSSGSEGEKESPPPEWDVPLKVSNRTFAKHVHKEPSPHMEYAEIFVVNLLIFLF